MKKYYADKDEMKIYSFDDSYSIYGPKGYKTHHIEYFLTPTDSFQEAKNQLLIEIKFKKDEIKRAALEYKKAKEKFQKNIKNYITITQEISRCKDCMFSKKYPLSSLNNVWYCTYNRNIIIKDKDTIPKWCPFR